MAVGVFIYPPGKSWDEIRDGNQNKLAIQYLAKLKSPSGVRVATTEQHSS